MTPRETSAYPTAPSKTLHSASGRRLGSAYLRKMSVSCTCLDSVSERLLILSDMLFEWNEFMFQFPVLINKYRTNKITPWSRVLLE
jgi:hypothetical protein